MIHLKRIFIIGLSAILLAGCTTSSSTKKKTTKTTEKATTNKSATEKKKTETTEQTSNPVLNTTSVTIKMGHTFQLKVTGNVSNQITWGSYDNSIAVVGPEGLIIPKSAGSTRITARVDDKTLTCYVTVTGTKTRKKTTSSTTNKSSSNSNTNKKSSSKETNSASNNSQSSENKSEENNTDDEPKTYLVVTYHYKDENGNEVSQVVHTEEISSTFLISGLTAESVGTKWVNEHQDEVKALYGNDGTFSIQTRES